MPKPHSNSASKSWMGQLREDSVQREKLKRDLMVTQEEGEELSRDHHRTTGAHTGDEEPLPRPLGQKRLKDCRVGVGR